ncbi:MAG: FHA domain-containing protein [Planctomycetes bacterium]|nr:FHA domain-containing protein [Planctomycetota bacterium]
MLVPFVGRIDFVVGRLPKADIQLRDMKVSRLHTQFFIDSRGRAFVRDLGSSGGTHFGNQKLPSGVIAPLTQGARVRVGDARFTFYDEQPPVNAPTPPSKSDPRGLIRTNDRVRTFAVEATVLAMDKVSAKTESGPAEAPPEVNPADFSDEPLGPSGKQEAVPAAKAEPAPAKPAAAAPAAKAAPARPAPAAPAAKAAPVAAKPGVAPADKPATAPATPAKPEANPRKKHTGIVEAPWDERDSNRSPAVKGEKRITLTPTGKAEPAAAAKPDAVSAQQKGPSGPVAPAKPATRPPAGGEVPLATAAFQPPPAAPAKPADAEERPRTSMPTVRLDRAAVQRVEEPEEEAPRLPTIGADAASAPAADEEEPAPRIGLQPGEAPPKPAEPPAGEDDLTDEQIVEYMGGSVSGRWGPVSFGDGQGNSSDQEEPHLDDHAPTEEVALGPVAAKVAGSLNLDLDDDLPAAPALTAPAPESTDTPPPAMGRQGASTEGGFGPRKTRKLMKRRAEERSTDKTVTPLPGVSRGAPTEVVPSPMEVRTEELSLTGGAKTQFIPKPEGAMLSRAPAGDTGARPEKATDKPKKMAENRDKNSVEDLAAGPGGDTVALPPDMMAALRAELTSKTEKADKPAAMAAGKPADLPADKPAEKPATIGESPTVRRAPEDPDSEGDDAEEFVLDDNYAFFTPPPPTRKGKSPLPDTIDAMDFAAEAEKLPPERQAGASAGPDTNVE